MKTPGLARICVIGALCSVSLLGACSSSPEENVAAACDALNDYSTSLDTYARTLTPEASVESVRDAREAVVDAKSKVDDSLESVESDRAEALHEAWQSMQDTLDDLDGNTTLSAAAQTLAAEATQVQQAREQLSASLNC